MTPLWLIPVLPVVAMVAILSLPQRWTRHAGGIASSGAGFATALMTVHLAATARGVQHASTTRLTFAGTTVDVGLATDPLSAVMGTLVAVTATLVLVYSIGYMAEDQGKRRFFAVMSLFTGAMLSLVLASDYLVLYLSWEAVGLCSYLLIGHYWQQQNASRAAFKAFLVTRIGDLGLLFAVVLMFAGLGTARFDAVLAPGPAGTPGLPFASVIAVLIVVGALGKSAQFPLHWWLPDAMAGPTPVSALIHSATMVAAGIYLLARSFPLLNAAPAAHNLILIAALVTTFGSALAAAAQTDVKRLLAYSTMSQLGEMGLAVALALPFAAVFQLIAHATFKALLFLAAGVVAQAAGSNALTGLPNSRVARWGFLAGALSLSGIPPCAGFWSKTAVTTGAPPALRVIFSALTFLSSFYIARAFFLGFTGRAQARTSEPLSFRIPMYALAGITLVTGFLWWPLAGLLRAPRPHLGREAAADVLVAGLGWAVAAALYKWRALNAAAFREQARGLQGLLKGGFGTDALPLAFARVASSVFQAVAAFETNVLDALSSAVARGVLRVAYGAGIVENGVFDRGSSAVAESAWRMATRTNWLDLRLLDRSVLRSAFALRDLGGRLRPLQTGRIYHYLAAVFLWIVVASAIAFALRW